MLMYQSYREQWNQVDEGERTIGDHTGMVGVFSSISNNNDDLIISMKKI